MEKPKLRVAIVGAGVTGIAAVKCCLDEGLEPVCFERSNTCGGLWQYRTQTTVGLAGVMKKTVCNTSKEMMAFSDLPPPKDFPVFMTHGKYREYIQLYVEHFNLQPHITLNTEVVKCDWCKGHWYLVIRNVETGKSQECVFGALLLCTGINRQPYMPQFPGAEQFEGEIIHSQQFKDGIHYDNKTVLVIGIGSSGCDAAVDMSGRATQVYLSTRSGAWVVNRIRPDGLPYDIIFHRRSLRFMQKFVPAWLTQYLAELKFSLNYELYSLKPSHKIVGNCHPVSEELFSKIITGQVIIKGDVKRLTARGVEFTDGTEIGHIDAIIMATGYRTDFPLLEEPTLQIIDNRKFLAYKHMFPPELMHKRLALLGFMGVCGSSPPLFEMQSRFALKVFKGEVNLPSKDEIKMETAAQIDFQIKADPIGYLDDLASIIGCKINLWKLLLTDPLLALILFFGPCTPYQFRLTGPGKWTAAKEAIMHQWDRIYYPLNKTFRR